MAAVSSTADLAAPSKRSRGLADIDPKFVSNVSWILIFFHQNFSPRTSFYYPRRRKIPFLRFFLTSRAFFCPSLLSLIEFVYKLHWELSFVCFDFRFFPWTLHSKQKQQWCCCFCCSSGGMQCCGIHTRSSPSVCHVRSPNLAVLFSPIDCTVCAICAVYNEEGLFFFFYVRAAVRQKCARVLFRLTRLSPVVFSLALFQSRFPASNCFSLFYSFAICRLGFFRWSTAKPNWTFVESLFQTICLLIASLVAFNSLLQWK